MIAGLKPYPMMKDSGVKWLGEVPSHWDVRRNGRLFAQRNETGFAELPVLEVSLRTGVRIRNFKNSDRKQVMSERDKYKRALAGDIAYNMMRMWQGAVGVAPVDGLISPAYVVARPLAGTEARYYEKLFRTPNYMQEIDNCSRGIVKDRNRLYWEYFKAMPACYPPPEEQDAIARYLEHMDRRVRRLVRSKRKLILLFDEQKQAIIHRAVTHGLASNVPLKDSGIDWIGMVPEHWEIQRIKQATQILRGKFTHRPRNDPSLYDGPYPFIQTGEVARAKKSITTYRQTLNKQGLAVSKMFPSGTLLMTIAANVGDVAVLDFEACFPDSIVGFVPRDGIERDYLYFMFRAMRSELLREAPVNTQGNLNIERIGSKRIVLPPHIEQQQIVREIEADTAYIDTTIRRANREIDLLNEYRTRLISDVVTGKLDVREAAAALPGVDPLALNDEANVTIDNDDSTDLDEVDVIPEEDDA